MWQFRITGHGLPANSGIAAWSETNFRHDLTQEAGTETRPSIDFPVNITDPIRRNARISPQARAVIRVDGRSVSYLDLDRTIDALAQRVRSLGLGPGAVAGLSIKSPYAQLVFALALARVGATGAPASFPAATMAARFTDETVAANDGVRTVTIDRTWTESPPESVAVEPVSSHQDRTATCRVFASSGTTGTPKHVAVSHDLMARRVFTKWLSVRAPDNVRQICTISTETGYGFRSALRTLWVGGLVVIATTPELVVSGIHRHGINFLVISPGSLQTVLALLPPDRGPIASLTSIEVGGGVLSTRLYELARDRLCAAIVSSYGSTESGNVASAPVPALNGRAGSVGYIVPGVEVQAVDANDDPLAAGTQGILRVRSDNCVAGYVGEPSISAEIFRNGWFYPGDVGTVTPDGMLILAGRTSDLINRGGEKVAPRVIEDALQMSEQVLEVAAFGVADAMGVTQIWAAVVPRGTSVDVAALDAFCRERLGVLAPRYFLRMTALPRNPSGKVLRDELVRRALAASRSPSDASVGDGGSE